MEADTGVRDSPGLQGLVRDYYRNLIPFHEIQNYRQELSGMLGDLGLYIPLVVTLSLRKQIGLAPTLIFSGLSNIITGLTFKVPMCVQPMKSIAAVALSSNLTESEIMASGILTGAIVLFLGLTNLITVINKIIPNSVVRGLQLGLALKFFSSALKLLHNSGKPSWSYENWVHWDGYLMGMFTLSFALVFVRSRNVPTALVLFLFGIIVAAARVAHAGEKIVFAAPDVHVVHFTQNDFKVGILEGAIPQVPTTLLNSCIAVCQLAEDLYPQRQTGVNVRSVSTSVGLINIIFCWFGGMPMCHGSGGLAGQHRFGARTNLSIIILGTCKFLLGLLFSAGLLELLKFFPQAILSALLALSSFELGAASRSGMSGSPDEIRAYLVTCCFTAFMGTSEGFVIGLVAYYLVAFFSMFVGSDEAIEEARSNMRTMKSDLVKYLTSIQPPTFSSRQWKRSSLSSS
uniref:SLC26A/SulP transporter domain-containing protein n=2 Tax=Guillardia theta TaxID=55529 RepID=A0A7S4ULA3_GUITH